jgi:hypothetical protein
MTVSLSVIEPGTIGDYQDLVSKVGDWLDRDDLDSQIPDFVALVEARLNRVLRAVNSEVSALWAVSDELYSLPSDFRKLRKLHIEGSPDRPLVEMSPVAIPTMFSGDTGTPRAYYIEGRQLGLAPPPDQSYTLRASYFQRIPPLTSAVPSNWVLSEHPDIYVWGTLMHAAYFIRDADAVDACSALFDQAIAELQRESRLDRWGAGPLVPNGPSQTRGGKC